MTKFSKKAWIEFAQETITNDEAKIKPNLKKFGNFMEFVFNKNKNIKSVLWETVNPNGTEDRTWIRTFLCLEGYKDYAGMLNSLDGNHARMIFAEYKAWFDQSDLVAVREEVKANELDEVYNVQNFQSFNDFWKEIDLINAYEEGWNSKKSYYKPLFRIVYHECSLK